MICFFLFKDTATTEIYTYGHTLSLHDALPISGYRFDRQRPQHFMNLQDWQTVFLRAEAKADPTRELAIALAGQRAHGNAAADTEAGAPARVATVLAAGVSPPVAIAAAVAHVAADVARAVTLVSSLSSTPPTKRRSRWRPLDPLLNDPRRVAAQTAT